MSVIENTLIRLGGYSPLTLKNCTHEEREPIAKLGWSVVLAVLVVSINWGIAAWTYSKGVSIPLIRYTIVIGGASIGASLVIFIDRSILYFTDTSIEKKFGVAIVYGVLRVLIILLVGSFTAQAVIPFFLSVELKHHSGEMRKSSEEERRTKLNTENEIDTKESAVTSAREEVERLEKELKKAPPPEIATKEGEERTCWAHYKGSMSVLMHNGDTKEEAKIKLNKEHSDCMKKKNDSIAAKTKWDNERKATDGLYRIAVTAKETASTVLKDTRTEIDTKVTAVSKEEEETITPYSSIVLWSLLKENFGVFLKFFSFYLLIIFLELFPLWVKLMAGQSSIGHRIASEKEIKRLQISEHLTKARHIASGMANALDTPEGRAYSSKVAFIKLEGYTPLQLVADMTNEILTRLHDAAPFKQRHPQYASIIEEAWLKAIIETCGILKRGIGKSPQETSPAV